MLFNSEIVITPKLGSPIDDFLVEVVNTLPKLSVKRAILHFNDWTYIYDARVKTESLVEILDKYNKYISR